jgi:hypothetical protein
VVKLSTARTGSAGAFYVSAQLAQRGWDTSLTIGNTPRTDVLAQHATHQRLVAVQCKTSTGSQDFVLSVGCESPSPPGRDEWFVLTTLGEPEVRPEFYVVPRNVISAYLHVGHRAWLRGTAKDGSPRRDNSMRNVELKMIQGYRERWDLMDGAASDVPHLLPAWVFAWEPHTGLPEGHPGIVPPDDPALCPDWTPGWLPSLPSDA